MAGTISLGGLSGIDTASLVDSLMSIEKVSQDRIKTNISTRETVLKALQALSTSVSSLSTKAIDLGKSTAWDLFSATSSKESVSAAGSTGAAAGSYTFDVIKTAASHKVLYSGAVASGATVVSGGEFTFTRPDGTETAVAVSPPTLQGAIKAINNKAGLDVRAVAVDMGGGQLRLQLTSNKSGEAAAFTVSGFDASMGTGNVATAGRDAVIQVGPDATTDRVTSASNTFTGVFPGVTFTVSKEETGVALDIAPDSKGLTAQMKGLVDSLNTLTADIRTKSAYTPATGSDTKGVAGPLVGDAGVRKLGGDLRAAVFDPSNKVSLATIGLQLTQSGSLKFDEAQFAKQLAADPEGTRKMAMDLAGRVADVSKPVLDKTKGFLTRSIATEQSTIKDLNNRVSDWDIRLELRRTKLEKQFTAMSVALGSLNSQQSYMSSQLSNLNS